MVARDTKAIAANTSVTGKLSLGLYLDNTGQWHAALGAWKSAAAMASQAGLPAVGANMLALGAFDQAVAGQCDNASQLLQGATTMLDALSPSQTMQFHAAIVAAMCGSADSARTMAAAMRTAFPQSTPVNNLFAPEILAAADIRSGDTDAALRDLEAIKQYQMISMAPYLRGLAHVKAGQSQLAIGDFQQVMEHRGAAYLSYSPIYALSQAGLGRAFAELGDQVNSAAAYRSFLASWKDADAAQPLVIEARAHLR